MEQLDGRGVHPSLAEVAERCPATGLVSYPEGGAIRQFVPWSDGWQTDKGAGWTVTELSEEMTARV